MKISKWEDLDGQKNKNYIVVISGGWVCIRNIENIKLLGFYINDVGKDIVLSILKAFGFNIEFEVPKITRWEKFVKEGRNINDIRKAFTDHYSRDKGRLIYNAKYELFINWLSELVEGE